MVENKNHSSEWQELPVVTRKNNLNGSKFQKRTCCWLYHCYCRSPHSHRVHAGKLEGVCRRCCLQRNEGSFSALRLPPNGWGQDPTPTFLQVKRKSLKRCGVIFDFPEEWTSFPNISKHTRQVSFIPSRLYQSFSLLSPTFHAITLCCS